MTTPRWLEEHEQSAWRAFLDMHSRLAAQLNRELQAAAGVSHADYAVLVALSEHPNGRLRVLELARGLGWEKSRLSHQLSRMQQRGLVGRADCADDRRGSFIEITDAGRRTIEEAAPSHVESVRHYVFDQLSDEQVDALDAIARSVLAQLEGACVEAEAACTETACSEDATECPDPEDGTGR